MKKCYIQDLIMEYILLNYNLHRCIKAIILLLFTSCSSMYMPVATNIPLLESKGDSKIDISTSTYSLQLGGDFAITDNLALMAGGNISYGIFTNYYDVFTNKDECAGGSLDLREYGEFNHIYSEIGIGRYNILKRKLKLEVFGGGGMGNATDYYYNANCNANYFLLFIQPNIGVKLEKAEFGGTIRFASSFYNYTYEVASSNNPDNNNPTQNINFNLYHIEPYGFVRIGGDKIKFITKIGLSLPFISKGLGELDLEKGISNGSVNTTLLHLSMGVNFRFSTTK